MEDRKTLIVAIVAGLLILGGVGYGAMKGGQQAPPPVSADVPATQLQNELPADNSQGSSGGDTPQVHSTE